MVQTLFLAIALYLVIHSIYASIITFQKLKEGIIREHNFIINIIMTVVGLTYILWYCN